MSDVDGRALRTAFGSYPTGVTVVTTLDDHGRPVGFTANSFTSVSIDPPMLLVCPARRLSCFDAFRHARHFAVNVLAADQQALSQHFASYRGDRFADVRWRGDAAGSPCLDDVAARFSCRTARCLPAGDHVILLGEVEAFSASGAPGLGYGAGGYFRPGAGTTDGGMHRVAGVILAHRGEVLMSRSAAGLHPPRLAVSTSTRVRRSLQRGLAARSLPVHLDGIYSLFDDPSTHTRYLYFLGRLRDCSPPPGLVGVPVQALHQVDHACPAHAAMMTRYAREAPVRAFGLYLGDSRDGDVHPFPAR